MDLIKDSATLRIYNRKVLLKWGTPRVGSYGLYAYDLLTGYCITNLTNWVGYTSFKEAEEDTILIMRMFGGEKFQEYYLKDLPVIKKENTYLTLLHKKLIR